MPISLIKKLKLCLNYYTEWYVSSIYFCYVILMIGLKLKPRFQLFAKLEYNLKPKRKYNIGVALLHNPFRLWLELFLVYFFLLQFFLPLKFWLKHIQWTTSSLKLFLFNLIFFTLLLVVFYFCLLDNCQSSHLLYFYVGRNMAKISYLDFFGKNKQNIVIKMKSQNRLLKCTYI